MSDRQFDKHYPRLRNDQKNKSATHFATLFCRKSFAYTLHYKEFRGISIFAHMCDLLMVFTSYAGVKLEHKYLLLSCVFSTVHILPTAKQEMPAIHNTSLHHPRLLITFFKVTHPLSQSLVWQNFTNNGREWQGNRTTFCSQAAGQQAYDYKSRVVHSAWDVWYFYK